MSLGRLGIPGRHDTLGRLPLPLSSDTYTPQRDKSAYSDNSDNSAVKPPYADSAKGGRL
jgi:hypothetical protein